MDPRNTISYVIAVCSFVFGLYKAWRAAKLQAERDALQKRSTEIQHRSTQLQYFAELRTWAGEAVDIVSDAVHFRGRDRRVFNRAHFLRQQQDLLRRLSAHLDRGRWFFPNVSPEPQRQEREATFGGVRHEIIQTLYRAYRVVRSLDFRCPEDNRRQRYDLRELQRYFVQQIQEVLNPANYDAEFREIVCPPDGSSWRPRRNPPELSRSYDYLDEDAIASPSGTVSARRSSEDRVAEDMEERIYGESVGVALPEGEDSPTGQANGIPSRGSLQTTPPKG